MGYGTHIDVWMPSVFSCSSTAGTPRGERSIARAQYRLFELVFSSAFFFRNAFFPSLVGLLAGFSWPPTKTKTSVYNQ